MQNYNFLFPILYYSKEMFDYYDNALAIKEAFDDKVILTPTSVPMEHMATCAFWMFSLFLMGL